jgi:hypothetical protein
MFALAVVSAAQTETTGVKPPPPEVPAEMKNVLHHYTDRLSARIFSLEGAVVPTQEGAIPVFGDAQSFAIRIHSARIAIGSPALSEILNRHGFSAKGAPLKDIEVSTEGQKLKVKG